MPHRMNLRGPWDVLSLTLPDADPGETPGRLHVPFRWREHFGTTAGSIRLRRRFGRPTNLDAGSRLGLVFDRIGGSAAVSVNGHELGTLASGESQRLAIEEPLDERNELVVELTCDPAADRDTPAGLSGLVGLLILLPHETEAETDATEDSKAPGDRS